LQSAKIDNVPCNPVRLVYENKLLNDRSLTMSLIIRCIS